MHALSFTRRETNICGFTESFYLKVIQALLLDNSKDSGPRRTGKSDWALLDEVWPSRMEVFFYKSDRSNVQLLIRYMYNCSANRIEATKWRNRVKIWIADTLKYITSLKMYMDTNCSSFPVVAFHVYTGLCMVKIYVFVVGMAFLRNTVFALSLLNYLCSYGKEKTKWICKVLTFALATVCHLCDIDLCQTSHNI